MQTMTNNRIQIDDTPGKGITLESRMGAKIVISDTGIEISDGMGGSIEINMGIVRINGNNLVVMK